MNTWHAVLWMTLGNVAAQPSTEDVVTWRNRVHPLHQVQTEAGLDRDAQRAVTTWSRWAARRDYRLVLSETGRVLLVLSPTYERHSGGRKEHNTVRRFLRSVERTVAEVERLSPEVPRHTAVVVGARRHDFAAVLQSVAEQNPSLGSWMSASARAESGFTLARPCVGVWIEDPQGTEEWNPENEVVHRTAAALWNDSFEHAPLWLRLGLTWHVEERVLGAIYCFPGHDGFVSVYDHTDWDRALQQRFKKRQKQPLALAEVADWNPRDGYDTERGYLAFGVARYLADHRQDALVPLLRDLHERTAAGRKVKTGPHSWRTDPTFALPVEAQQQAFASHGGQDLWDEVAEYFRKGKRYRRS